MSRRPLIGRSVKWIKLNRLFSSAHTLRRRRAVNVRAVQKAMVTDGATAVKVLGQPPISADYQG